MRPTRQQITLLEGRIKHLEALRAADLEFISTLISELNRRTPTNIKWALTRINQMAEADIRKGGPIEGAHHRAIEKVLRNVDSSGILKLI